MISLNAIIILIGIIGLFYSCYFFLNLNIKHNKRPQLGFAIYLFSLWIVFYSGWIRTPWCGVIIYGTIMLHAVLLYKYQR